MKQPVTATKFNVSDVLTKADEIFFGVNPETTHGHSEKQWAFKQKLFTISRERRTKEIAQCMDVDATAYLSENEYKALIQEAQSLQNK
jgi:hypothetical protein